MEKTKKQMKKFYEENKKLVWIFTIVFLIMIPLNMIIPLICDDFAYTASFADGQRIKNIPDIINSQIAHYKTMNGRIITHSLVQLFLMLPKIFIVIFNSLAFALLGLVIYKHINIKNKKNPILLISIYMMIWFLAPAFAETILWKDGSINYLWGTLIILVTLLPFKTTYDKNKKTNKLLYLMPILGFISGFCSENTSGAMILFVILLILYKYIKYKKINLWEILTLISMMIGFVIMIKAPGNALRKATIDEYNIFTRIYEVTKYVTSKTLGISIFAYIYLLARYVYMNKTIKGIEKSIGMFFCFIAGCYSLILSPFGPERAFFGPYMLGIIGLLDLFMKSKISIKKHVLIPSLSCLLIVFLASYFLTIMDNGRIYIKFLQREKYIVEEKEKGNKDIEVEMITNNNYKRCPWMEITYDEKSWQNIVVANYYGIDTIVLK